MKIPVTHQWGGSGFPILREETQTLFSFEEATGQTGSLREDNVD